MHDARKWLCEDGGLSHVVFLKTWGFTMIFMWVVLNLRNLSVKFYFRPEPTISVFIYV